ncbi:MAG: GTP cyclohydrolase II [bacterium]|nr:GTP cyclohydrolase II [bacterium]
MTNSEPLPLSPLEEVIADYSQGKMVIIVDDDNRENEGDLAIATEHVTAEIVAFMQDKGRGLVCISIDKDVADRLKLSPQVENNNSRYGTPFTASVDHQSVCHSGMSASSRAVTMREMISDKAQFSDFVAPGHVFPLVANPSGVLGRRGQTEGSLDLARLSGLKPSGVICEILNSDGTMARGEELIQFAQEHNLKITSIDEIAKHIVANEIIVKEVTRKTLQTDYGEFLVSVFENHVDGKEHLALTYGIQNSEDKVPIVRIHSECLTGDVFGSRRCDCGLQLSNAMEEIVKYGTGALLYLRQEGRGIGLANKLRAYELQDRGRDTVEANIELGFEADARDFAVAAKMLDVLNLRKIRLLTNNPIKLETLRRLGIEVVERVSFVTPEDEYSRQYLETKRSKLGHLI